MGRRSVRKDLRGSRIQAIPLRPAPWLGVTETEKSGGLGVWEEGRLPPRPGLVCCFDWSVGGGRGAGCLSPHSRLVAL